LYKPSFIDSLSVLLLLHQKRQAGTTALGINRKHSMSKERRLLEMFLLCWQGYEIKQVDQSSGAGRLQRPASVVSIWSCDDKAPCLVLCCFFSSLSPPLPHPPTPHTHKHTRL